MADLFNIDGLFYVSFELDPKGGDVSMRYQQIEKLCNKYYAGLVTKSSYLIPCTQIAPELLSKDIEDILMGNDKAVIIFRRQGTGALQCLAVGAPNPTNRIVIKKQTKLSKL